MINLTKSNSEKFGVRKQGIKTSVHLGKITLGVITLSLIFLLGLFYIAQVNNTSTLGYNINDLEKRIQNLQEDQQSKEVQKAKLQSIHGLETESVKLNFNNVEAVDYTTPLSSTSSYALR